MSIGTRKDRFKHLLAQRNYDELPASAGSTQNAWRVLLSLTYDQDELIRWRAIEAIGKVAGLQAGSDIDRVRDFIRRLLWLMNDESGGLGWRSPELIGEILVNVPDLAEEFATLLTGFLKEEPFERGTHLAVYRIASAHPGYFIDTVPKLRDSLSNPDPTIRGYAACALHSIDPKSHRHAIEKLLHDQSHISWYDFDTGLLKQTTVGLLVKEGVAKAALSHAHGVKDTQSNSDPALRRSLG